MKLIKLLEKELDITLSEVIENPKNKNAVLFIYLFLDLSGKRIVDIAKLFNLTWFNIYQKKKRLYNGSMENNLKFQVIKKKLSKMEFLNPTLQKINHESESIFKALEWELEINVDDLKDFQMLKITIDESDLRDHYNPELQDILDPAEVVNVPFEEWFENCDEFEFESQLLKTAIIMLKAIDADGNIDGFIYDEPDDQMRDLFSRIGG